MEEGAKENAPKPAKKEKNAPKPSLAQTIGIQYFYVE
jgi:hypothetical protein